MDDLGSYDDLIRLLETADRGSRRLDVMIAYYSGDFGREANQMVRLLVDEGASWDLIFELLDREIPEYTESLDATIPGENIVCSIFSSKHGRWAAVQRSEQGEEVLAWGPSEILARRLAGLQGLRPRQVAGESDRLSLARLDLDIPRPEVRGEEDVLEAAEAGGASGEWKILF